MFTVNFIKKNTIEKIRFYTQDNNDFREEFFIYAFHELLDIYSLHSYQNKYANIFTCISEMLEYISIINNKNLNENFYNSILNYLKNSYDDMKIHLKDDCIIDKILDPSVLDKIKLLEAPEPPFLEIKSLLLVILYKQREYNELLIEELKKSLFSPLSEIFPKKEDISFENKDIISKHLYKIVKLYVSMLVQQGFMPTYLFNRLSLLVRSSHYKNSNSNFKSQFEKYFIKNIFSKNIFTIYLLINKINERDLPIYIDECRYVEFDSLPEKVKKKIKQKSKKRNNRNASNTIIEMKIESNNYKSAIFKANRLIDTHLSVIKLFNSDQKYEASFFSYLKIESHEYVEHMDLNHDLRVITSAKNLYLKADERNITYAINNSKLTDESKKKLTNSLQYFKQSQESYNMEDTFLNLWIALESLFKNENNKSNTESIYKYIPIIYSQISLVRKLRYIYAILIYCEIINPNNNTPFSEQSISEKELFTLLTNNNLYKKLLSNLEDYPFFQFRVARFVTDDLSCRENTLEVIKNSQKNLRIHLNRIYYIRNKIVHTGEGRISNIQIIEHLFDYLIISYLTIIKMSNQFSFLEDNMFSLDCFSLEDIFTRSKVLFELKIDNQTSNNLVSEIFDLYFS